MNDATIKELEEIFETVILEEVNSINRPVCLIQRENIPNKHFSFWLSNSLSIRAIAAIACKHGYTLFINSWKTNLYLVRPDFILDDEPGISIDPLLDRSVAIADRFDQVYRTLEG